MEYEEQRQLLATCALCPRNCRVNRLAGQTGYCGQGGRIRAARAALHFWEEPCISGKNGSGAVFFSGCPMRCVFCQNHDIAAGRAGQEIGGERLAEIFLELQEKGAVNINLVTPTHFVPLIVPALERAKRGGLSIPVVYNTSSYEKVSTLRLLEGLVDIYLPDFKYVSSELSERYSNAPDYFETAKAAVGEMVRQVGEPVFGGPDGQLYSAEQMNLACGEEPEEAREDADFLMKKGVIVRHLALPGQEDDSRRVIRYLLDAYGDKIYISLMNQYTPMPAVRGRRDLGELGRRLTDAEYERLIDFALESGIENGFIQEGETAKESFIPAFDGEGL
ncbi:MAG: radical SAM protein [Eubacteriales bacterium]|nr:radical SAM protein [Eubacteriales bacterium]